MVKKHLRMLVVRAVVFFVAVGIFIYDSSLLDFTNVQSVIGGVFLFFCCAMLIVGMLYRVFPNTRISAGARRHFLPLRDEPVSYEEVKGLGKKVLRVAFVWVIFNVAVIFLLHIFGVLSPSAVILVTLFYALCDVVFILFWCPFRQFFMRNRCCSECRIYNWDYMMMVTPLVIFPSVFSGLLVAMAGFVFMRWEVAARRNPRPFLPGRGTTLSCAGCEDKLCHFKGRKGF